MPVRWKLVGLAGLAGVTATGVVVNRRRRDHREYDPEEIREKLRSRVRASEDEELPTAPGDPPPAR